MDLFTRKVPQRTQVAIEKVAEIVSKMGGQIRTHVQDNGGSNPPLPLGALAVARGDLGSGTFFADWW